MQDGLREHAGPGHWNDPDMMEVGNGMSVAEDRAHFSLWAMLAAPLIAGNDLRSMSEETAAILTNPDVIAVDQDPLGIQGFKYQDEGALEIWIRPFVDGDWAMTILNRWEPGSGGARLEQESVGDNLSSRNAAFSRPPFTEFVTSGPARTWARRRRRSPSRRPAATCG